MTSDDWPDDDEFGGADLLRGYASGDNGSEARDRILYLPDLAEMTGWTTYTVSRRDRSNRTRRIGFSRS